MPIITADNGFEQFYERHYKMVYRICFTYMKNQSEAEDCTEDVFVKVLTGEISFQDETHEKKWLTVTAINLCKDRLKHWFRRMVSPIEDVEEPAGEGIPEPDETLEIVKKLPTKSIKTSSTCTIIWAIKPMKSPPCFINRRQPSATIWPKHAHFSKSS